jgi:MFS family permease
MGSSLTTFTVMLREKHNTNSPMVIALLGLAMMIPNIVLAPWAGLIADKFSSRAVIPPALVIMGLSSTSITFIPYSWWAFVALFITASAGVAVGASFRAVEATITLKEDMPRVQGMQGTYINLGILLGPALGGTLVQTTGYFWPFIIDGLTFGVLALVFLLTRVNRPGVTHEDGEKLSAMAGVKFVFGDRLIRALVVLLTVLIVALGVVNIGEIFLIIDELHATEFIYGMTAVAFAIGSIAGSLLTGVLKVAPAKNAPITIAAIAVLTVSVIGMALSPHWSYIIVISVVAGISNAMLNAYGIGIVLQRADEEKRGRIMAAVSGIITAGSLSANVIAGVALEYFNVRSVLMVGGIIALIILAILGPEVIRANRPKQVSE